MSIYKCEIAYEDGWLEEICHIVEKVEAKDYIEALRIVLNRHNFTDNEIESITIEFIEG